MGAASSSRAIAGAAGSTCSKLSTRSRSSDSLSADASCSSASFIVSGSSSASRIARVTSAGSRRVASLATQAPCLKSGASAADELEREPRLADAADSGQRQKTCLVAPQEVGESLELALAPEQRGRGCRDAACGRRRVDVQRRILLEDRALELAQRLAGLDPQLLDQRAACALVHGERVGLAARAVEREHQLPAQPLAQRVLRDQPLELGDELRMTAEREVGVDPVFERRRAAAPRA